MVSTLAPMKWYIQVSKLAFTFKLHRYAVAKLYKPIIVERCTFKVSQKNKRVTVVLHKFDNLSWRFLKG